MGDEPPHDVEAPYGDDGDGDGDDDSVEERGEAVAPVIVVSPARAPPPSAAAAKNSSTSLFFIDAGAATMRSKPSNVGSQWTKRNPKKTWNIVRSILSSGSAGGGH